MNHHNKPTAMDKQLDVLCFHPDGGLLLGASCMTTQYWSGSLWFYQTPEAAPNVDQCTAVAQLGAGIGDAQWVDQTHVIVGLDTGEIAVWSLEDDYRRFVLSHSATGHDGIVTSVSVVCDKTKAASSSHDKCIRLWDLPNTSLINVAQGHSDLVSSVDCHPSEPDVFVSCGQDNKILLWDQRRSKPASNLNPSPLIHAPTCVKWQPESTHRIAVGSESGQVSFLDTRMSGGSYLSSFPHSRCVYRLQFCSKKPSLLASVSEDCTTVVTSVDDGDLRKIYSDSTHQDFAHGLAWASESQVYTCGWDARVIAHNVTQNTSSVGGGDMTVLTNGDVERSKKEKGAGDRIELMDTDRIRLMEEQRQ